LEQVVAITRCAQADKVRCGQRHFDALGVSFAVATTADDI
jgi:hypothetical protein